MTDPVQRFEHSHATLTRLALDVREMIRPGPDDRHPPGGTRPRLLVLLGELREELLGHFANEEEGLFPFVRRSLPSKAETVDRLQDSHDAICGALVRLAHLIEHDPRVLEAHRGTLTALHDRFEKAYGEHSQDEAVLFAELGRQLGDRQRGELAEILQGL